MKLESSFKEPPISAYLRLQQQLDTPVARFSREHQQSSGSPGENVTQLIPLSAPAPGEQYAFAVDLDACSGCKACVSACHSLNGLEEDETWRDVGVVLSREISPEAPVYQQTITTACHHCEDPGCLNGCPVLAYDKDPLTGIVRHLDDQCIGCQYCILKCPYDVPKFSHKLGIVRKCDMCHGRLAVGEAPACVQACPTQAIRISTVARTTPNEPMSKSFFPDVFPDARITRPTTRYISRRSLPENLTAADAGIVRVQHGHPPLVWMLTLSQVSVGLFVASVLAGGSTLLNGAALLLLIIGLGASVLHLGRPLGAWRAFLGLRKSWLSREIVVFGGVAPMLILYTSRPWLPVPDWMAPLIGVLLILGGLSGVFCSAMIYVDTHRPYWSGPRTFLRFFGVFMVAGFGAHAYLERSGMWGWMTGMLLLILATADVSDLRLARHVGHPVRRSSQLLGGPLWGWLCLRTFFSTLASLFWIVAIELGLYGYGMAMTVTIAAELTGRLIFFKAVDAPKMPGGLTL